MLRLSRFRLRTSLTSEHSCAAGFRLAKEKGARASAICIRLGTEGLLARASSGQLGRQVTAEQVCPTKVVTTPSDQQLRRSNDMEYEPDFTSNAQPLREPLGLACAPAAAEGTKGESADDAPSEPAAVRDEHLERLAKPADTLWEWSGRIFELALTGGETAVQTAVLAREGMTLGKGYADLIDKVEQRRTKLASKS